MAVMGESFFGVTYSCFINTPHSGYNIREPKECISFQSNTFGIQTEYLKLKVTVYTITVDRSYNIGFSETLQKFCEWNMYLV